MITSSGLAAVFGVCMAAGAAHAGPINLVQNGDFETTSLASSTQMNTSNVANWSTTGYNFIYFAGTADTTGSYTPEYNSNILLWGPNDGSNNGLTAASPTGGNFVAADGAYQVAAITQTINNLTIGTNYQLTFYWAGAQQQGYNGPTTEQWIVSFGNQTHATAVANNADHGFTGWMEQTFLFQATSNTEVLSFLSAGTPNGEPPFSLLDGVSLVDAPEPASWTLLGGVMLVGGMSTLRRRRRAA